jgi:WD40 repeat protein
MAQTTVGGSINNAICISQHGNAPKIYVCNNDETIKVFSLPDLQRITHINIPTAVNYASVSPDGTKLLAVGDSDDVFLFEIGSNGAFHKTATLKGSADAAFSCAWNQSSNKFAVATQDGFVCVWYGLLNALNLKGMLEVQRNLQSLDPNKTLK